MLYKHEAKTVCKLDSQRLGRQPSGQNVFYVSMRTWSWSPRTLTEASNTVLPIIAALQQCLKKILGAGPS